MFKTETLSQLKQLKQDIKASRNIHTGTVKGTSNKFGFVTLDEGKDIFLPADEMAKVLPGDRIEVEVKKEPKNKTFALVERLLESPTKSFFGKYMVKGKAHFVEADIAGMSQWFFIPPNKRKDAKARDMVRCKVSQHPIKNGKAQAQVLEIIGNEQDAGIEWTYAQRKYEIEPHSEDILALAKELNEGQIERLSEGREDLTDLPFVTVDSATTVDMDDALCVTKSDDGWCLKVAIADPTAWVEPGSKLEKNIISRASATYFPGENVPMLPSILATDLCSLQEGKKRLAKVLTMSVSHSGELLSTEIVNAIICSVRKFSYQDAADIIEQGRSSDLVESMLVELGALSKQLNAYRTQHALVPASRAEFYLELSDKKKISQIIPKPLTVAHSMVEECMLIANRAVANVIAEIGVDSIFVGHEGVRSDRKAVLLKVLQEALPDLELSSLESLEQYVQAIQGLSGSDQTKPLLSLVSRQLARSAFCSQPKAHFGLGFERYTTFTSPIRKANDFLLHRQIDQWIKGQQIDAISEETVAGLDTRTQQIRSAVSEVEQWLKCQYMADKKDCFDAEVVRVFASGCQVRLLENGIEGFVSTRDLKGKFSYHQDLMSLKGEELSFELDQKLKVKKKLVDWSRKQVMFIPAED